MYMYISRYKIYDQSREGGSAKEGGAHWVAGWVGMEVGRFRRVESATDGGRTPLFTIHYSSFHYHYHSTSTTTMPEARGLCDLRSFADIRHQTI